MTGILWLWAVGTAAFGLGWLCCALLVAGNRDRDASR